MSKYYYSFDIFISYVVEDREIVELIVSSLKSKGFRIWYARKELLGGDDINSQIDEGLAESRFGIALVSPDYKSNWVFKEFFTLLQRKKRLIPLLHNVSIEDVIADNPAIGQDVVRLFALSTERGI